MKKLTKIVATIGPASYEPAILKKLLRAGMNVARLNFSHGTYEAHADYIKRVHAAAATEKLPVGIMQDLQGPRLRLGVIPEGGFELKKGETWTLVPGAGNFEKKSLPVKFPQLAKCVKPGERILIADGVYELLVKKISGKDVVAEVVRGGVLTSNKGLNFPDSTLDIPVITAKDKADLEFGVKHEVDYVALSFVKSAADVAELRKLIAKHQPEESLQPRVVVKIERPEALENLEELVMATDAVMVARGDLGIEIPIAQVPTEQKRIIELCLAHGKTVITATQMLESMIKSPIPTRAEVSDVANAIWDLTDAVMLSGETAGGKFPEEAVALMSDVAERSEMHAATVYDEDLIDNAPYGDVFAGTAEMSHHTPSRFVLMTDDDADVRELASFRQHATIEVISSNPRMAGRCAMIRGVQHVHVMNAKQLAAIRAKRALPFKVGNDAQDIVIDVMGNEPCVFIRA